MEKGETKRGRVRLVRGKGEPGIKRGVELSYPPIVPVKASLPDVGWPGQTNTS